MSVNPRVEYEMSKEDLEALLEACRSVPYMIVGGYAPFSPQENANAAWARLGEKMGFDHMTVRPGNSQRKFSAVPSETEAQREARMAREVEEKRAADIAQLKSEIAERQFILKQMEK